MLMIKIIFYFAFILVLTSCLLTELTLAQILKEDFNDITVSTERKTNQTYDNNYNDTVSSTESKPNLTLDEFFDYTTFPCLSFSPTGQHLLFQTRRPSWNSSSYENSLWIYHIQTEQKELITNDLSPFVTPQWSFSGKWIALVLNENSKTPISNNVHYKNESSLNESDDSKHPQLSLYSIGSNGFWRIRTGKEIPDILAWSDNDSSIYIQSEQKEQTKMSTIYRIDIEMENGTLSVEITTIKEVSFLISELLFVPFEKKLIFSSRSTSLENVYNFEIYSLDLQNVSSLTRWTNNTIIESHLKLSADNKNVLFSVRVSSDKMIDSSTQGLYALNLTNGQVTRIGNHFNGTIMEYTPRSDGGMYIVGQWKTEVQIYSQQSTADNWHSHHGFKGAYESIASSSNPNCSIAVVHSSLKYPMEVFCINDTDNLLLAKQITFENELFNQRNLPQMETYSWINEDDNTTIEGILHYPPGKFKSKNLPLFVLIHGGPESASLNRLSADYHDWAPFAASEGWLVLEPNYRGSTGYGSQFMKDLRRKPLSLAGRDILSGVDRLIKDGIADPYRLAVGGCSYGGSLTNWLITQTKRFNAALSCAGTVEIVSDWGITDDPNFYSDWYDGSLWTTPHIYQNESPMYQLDRVRTPTHICTGQYDVRVPTDQSYILERGLYKRGIPVKLIIFQNVGHSLITNPWHGKIKVREELKWLNKYGKGQN